ncbi:hypothetical protein BLOT_005353 [Blomia tropicalis]|nr:hypothetical protein BLOT_005353 [Blomia tropicalis]
MEIGAQFKCVTLIILYSFVLCPHLEMLIHRASSKQTPTTTGCLLLSSSKYCRVLSCGLLFIYIIAILVGTTSCESISHFMGPVFIDEPSSRTHFSNTTGAVITCTATSSIPPVKIWWVLADGQTPVTDVAGLRYVRPNGQLVFPPFPIGQYRQDIHSTTYRCMASNSFGTIRSRDCQVRAVRSCDYNWSRIPIWPLDEQFALYMWVHIKMGERCNQTPLSLFFGSFLFHSGLVSVSTQTADLSTTSSMCVSMCSTLIVLVINLKC